MPVRLVTTLGLYVSSIRKPGFKYILAFSALFSFPNSLIASNTNTNTNTLVLAGAGVMTPLVSKIAKEFEKHNPGSHISIQASSSMRGISDLRSNKVNVGLVSRALKSDENDLSAHIIATDGLCIIAHNSNPVTTLRKGQIINIFKGLTKNWKSVGGKNQRIIVVNKEKGRVTRGIFNYYFELNNNDLKAHIITKNNEQAIKAITNHPDAIGYVSVGKAKLAVAHGAPIKLLLLEGIEPTAENIRSGYFPITRPLNFVTKGNPTPLAQHFIDFSRSKEANNLIEDNFFIPLVQ